MNKVSSRTHLMITLKIKKINRDTQVCEDNFLTFIDTAGKENLRKSNPED